MGGKLVAFNVTPAWWTDAPAAAKQLVVAAVGALMPQRLPGPASVFAVGDSVFAYDIPVPENARREDLAELRTRIMAEIDAVRSLLPPAWVDGELGDLSALEGASRFAPSGVLATQ